MQNVTHVLTNEQSELRADTAEASRRRLNARANIGLDQVDNTSDADKPISSATQDALDSKMDVDNGTYLKSAEVSGNGYTLTIRPNNGDVIEFQGGGIVETVQADWAENSPSDPSFIKNKPDLSGFATTSAMDTALEQKQDTIDDLNTIRSGAAAGATAVQPSVLDDYATTSDLATGLAGKQETIDDLSSIREGASAGATAVQPAALSAYATTSDVSNALADKQDVISDLSTIREGASSGATAVQPESLATVATTGNYEDLNGSPDMSTYATTNALNDAISGIRQVPVSEPADLNKVLTVNGSGTPVWAPAQGGGGGGASVNDVTVNGTSVVDSNGVGVVIVPTKTSDLTNDSDFVTSADIPTSTSDLTNDSGYITSSDIPAQSQADWAEADNSKPSFIKNKPTIPSVPVTDVTVNGSSVVNNGTAAVVVPAQVQVDWNSSSGLSEILHKPDLSVYATTSAMNTALADKQDTISNLSTIEAGAAAGATAVQPGELSTVATSGQYSDLTGTPTIPTKTSDLTNDSSFITLSDVPAQVQADWTESDNTKASFVKNKPSNLVQDASYVHTDNNYTNADKNKLDGIASGAEANVQSDWNQTDDTADDFIKNKPTIPSFSQTQMDAINSGITSTKVGNYDGHLSDTDVHVTTSDKSAWNAKYDKPSGGIPKTDLADAVQTSLRKADTALQSHQDISGKADKVSGATSGNFAALDGNGNLVDSSSKASDFATSSQGTKADSAIQGIKVNGSSQSPDANKVIDITVPAAQVNSDWNSSSGVSEILNKPNLGIYAEKSEMSVTAGTGTDADKTTIQLKTGLTATVLTAHQDISGKQDTISDLQTIRDGASAGATAYQKPSGGIPDTDLSAAVQTSLGKADTALQSQDISGKADKVSGATTGNFAGLDANGNITDSGSKASDFATAAQGGKADSAVQPGDLATVATSGSYTDLSGTPDLSGYVLSSSLATVATSGDYNDLDNLPTIPTIPTVDQSYDAASTNAQSGTAVASAISDKADKVSSATNGNFAGLDSNGNLTDSGSKAGDFATSAQGTKADSAIQSVKVNGSALTPDANKAVDITVPAAQVKSDWNSSSGLSEILNKPDLSVYALKSEMSVTAGTGTDADKTTITLQSGTAATVLTTHQDITGKQDVISDLSTIRSGAEAGATAYQKPSGGIPYADLSSAVQASLDKADTALQSHQDISGKADKVSGATTGNFAGLDANGNLTDSGSKASDFATAAQGAKADSAYQLPSGGMPSTDMATAVQTSLGKADSAIQSVKVNGSALTPDANKAVDITINNSTVTIDMAGTASSPNRAVGSFTVDQSSASTITIPAAVSAVPAVLDQNNEVVTAAVPAQPGVLSSSDKEKLDGLFNVTGSSTIALDPSTHAVSAIVGPDGGVVSGANGLIVQPDLVSRVVYVGADCVYNDKTFWSDSTTVDGIIADYANQTVTDYRGNGVPLARFVAEYDSNRYRIANIDETPGTVEYNRKIGGQIIDLMRSDFWMSSHPTYDIIKFDKDMDKLFDLLMTGSPMNAYLLLNNMTSTAFITDARREMYMDMIKAYDAWPYADKDTAYADFMDEHSLDRFVQVSTSWPLNSWTSTRYLLAGTPTTTDKVIFVLRHAERGSDTSVNGDITQTGVDQCTSIGTQNRNGATWSSYTITNFPANDTTYYATEYLRCKHTAQALAAARLDTDFDASDYSEITVEADLLNQYRFFYQPAESGNTTLLKTYVTNPSQLTSSQLSENFGVSSAAEAQTKFTDDYVRICKEILNKSTARMNIFITHDFFTLPLAYKASNGNFNFSGSGTDNRTWINYLAGIGMVLHADDTYEVMPVRGRDQGTMDL